MTRQWTVGFIMIDCIIALYLLCKSRRLCKSLALSVGFGEFEESGARDGVAVRVDHQITIPHHGQVLPCEQCNQVIVHLEVLKTRITHFYLSDLSSHTSVIAFFVTKDPAENGLSTWRDDDEV